MNKNIRIGLVFFVLQTFLSGCMAAAFLIGALDGAVNPPTNAEQQARDREWKESMDRLNRTIEQRRIEDQMQSQRNEIDQLRNELRR